MGNILVAARADRSPAACTRENLVWSSKDVNAPAKAHVCRIQVGLKLLRTPALLRNAYGIAAWKPFLAN